VDDVRTGKAQSVTESLQPGLKLLPPFGGSLGGTVRDDEVLS
jgi:hypothetical protein